MSTKIVLDLNLNLEYRFKSGESLLTHVTLTLEEDALVFSLTDFVVVHTEKPQAGQTEGKHPLLAARTIQGIPLSYMQASSKIL